MVTAPEVCTPPGFDVHLENFSGPFEVLLSLIHRRTLDITEVALAEVTDEFMAYIRDMEHTQGWGLSAVSDFLVVAATLLDLKIARLLPQAIDDPENIELLEAKDLLFARLLQYRAYSTIADQMRETWRAQGLHVPREVPLDPEYGSVLPPLIWTLTSAQLVDAARRVLDPPPPPQVPISHLHQPVESVAHHAQIIRERLQVLGTVGFAELVKGSTTAQLIARFLAVLDLVKERVITVTQLTPFEDLTLSWCHQTHPKTHPSKETGVS